MLIEAHCNQFYTRWREIKASLANGQVDAEIISDPRSSDALQCCHSGGAVSADVIEAMNLMRATGEELHERLARG